MKLLMAERRGFEPRNQLPSYYLSKRVHSTFALSFEPSAMPYSDKLFGICLDLV